ncbi:MAG TPA: hypothetical protein RMG45_09385, partial [Polyangiaceae bacterium LLY-WYZ-15_(1-7)]|nr:hypothetical protein [Polyangiaceae bacterium LLY-WYZ-15_(1-7)]
MTLTAPMAAGAQDTPSLAGQWRAGPLQIRNVIGRWGDDCPQRLPATQTEPGGAVTISESGDHLRFSGAVRGATNACWSERPGLRRISARYEANSKTWTVICRTPSSDAQQESGRYTFRLGSDGRLGFEERTEWDWRLNESHCQATRRATRTFTRVDAAGTTEPEPEP